MSRMRRSGFTLLELLIVIILVLVLFGVASWHLLPLPAAAEAAAVERNIAVMRRALGAELSVRVLQPDKGELGELHHANPVALMAQPPSRYLGEKPGPDPADIPPGHWYFDSAAGELVYRVRSVRWFETELEGPPRIRLRLELEYSDRDGSGRYNPATDIPHGLDLRRLDAYEWRDPSPRRLLSGDQAE